MESVALEVESCHLPLRHLDALGIGVGVEFTADGLGWGALISGHCLSLNLALHAAQQASSISVLSVAGGIVVGSGASRDPRELPFVQSRWRTLASASLKVGCDFRYQLAIRTVGVLVAYSSSAQSGTRENRPRRTGVVRSMALSDHCRWVSTPRWRRTSAKVTSIDQRRTNQRRMSSGSALRSVQRNAWGSRSPVGSRTRT